MPQTNTLVSELRSSDEMMAKSTPLVFSYFGITLLVFLLVLHLLKPTAVLIDFDPASSVQDIANKKFVQLRTNQSSQSTIKSINLIGERHTGTKWITAHLQDCFGDQVQVLNRFTRYKHWFQYEDPHLYPPNSIVVVALVRDPYDWLESMRKRPYHSPNHFDLDWEAFLTRPWGMDRGPGDQQLIQEGSTLNATCMHRFSFNNIIPCSQLDRNMYNGTRRNGKKIGVTYELNQDGSGNAYESILQLRSDKIQNFLNISSFNAVRAFYPVQFEYLVAQGTSELIEELERVTGFKARCKSADPQPLKEKSYNESFIHWVNEHLNWETEHLIGYSKRVLLDDGTVQ